MPHSKLLPYLHKSHWGIVTEKGIRVIHHTKMKGNWLFFYVIYTQTHMASHFLVKKKDVLETHIIENKCRIQYLQFKYVPGFLYKIDSAKMEMNGKN